MNTRFSVTPLETPIRLYQLRYMFYSPDILCSTSINGEYTIYKYVGKDDAIFESLSVQYDPRVYYGFSVHEDLPGISHVGIVHFLSGLFTDAEIPILYVNTYASNLIFFSEEFKEKVESVMKSHPRILFS